MRIGMRSSVSSLLRAFPGLVLLGILPCLLALWLTGTDTGQCGDGSAGANATARFVLRLERQHGDAPARPHLHLRSKTPFSPEDDDPGQGRSRHTASAHGGPSVEHALAATDLCPTLDHSLRQSASVPLYLAQRSLLL
jgi:hypothetical protein